jgi:hypothetical protein
MDREDHKTYIPGVGFLVTSWDGSESHIFKTPAEETAMDIEQHLTLDNAVAWDAAENSEMFISELLGTPPWNPDFDVTYNRMVEGFENLLEEADAYENDGQPSEYEEWQDYMGGDDWDHGQYDDGGEW